MVFHLIKSVTKLLKIKWHKTASPTCWVCRICNNLKVLMGKLWHWVLMLGEALGGGLQLAVRRKNVKNNCESVFS